MKTILKGVTIKNFKTIEHEHLVFNGDSFLLKGKNGAGKSSFMQAILIALGIETAVDGDAADLVMKGKDKGSIELPFERDGEKYVCLVQMNAKKNTVNFTVTHADGRAVKGGPKTFIKAAAGPYVDIFQVLQNQQRAEGRKENEKMFLKLANLDYEKLTKFNDDLSDKEKVRTVVGQNRDAAKGYVEKTRDTVNPEKYKEEKDLKPLYDEHHQALNAAKWSLVEKSVEVNEKYDALIKPNLDKSELLTRIGEVNERKASYDKWVSTKASGEEQLNDNVKLCKSIDDQIIKLQSDLKEALDKQAKISDGLNQCTTKIKELSPVLEEVTALHKESVEFDNNNLAIDSANERMRIEKAQALKQLRTEVETYNALLETNAKKELDTKVNELTEWNKHVAAAKEYIKQVRAYESLKEEWEVRQQAILNLRRDRTNYIMTGVFPIPGMRYDEETLQVVYNDMPLGEHLMSTGQTIILGAALNAAYNPNGANLMCIPNASLLDKANFKEAIKVLEDHEMFGLFEVVTEAEALEIEVLTEGI